MVKGVSATIGAGSMGYFYLPMEHCQTVHKHVIDEYPYEACGIIIGKKENNSWHTKGVMTSNNMKKSEGKDVYELDPQKRISAEKIARSKQQEVIGFYHSHPDHEAYFSERDLTWSEEYRWGEPWVPPTYIYLVVSVYEGQVKSQSSFMVKKGRAFEVAING